MNDDSIVPFGPGGLTFIVIYLLSLIGIGYYGHRVRRENTLKDFYLAGSGVGFMVLLLTLYATQYSGNTLFGFSGKAYRIGFAWIICVHFMTAIIVCYLLFAPKLLKTAKQNGFITPADYLDHRFGVPGMNVLASLIMVVALANYLLAQLTAMGRAMQGLTTVDPAAAFMWGVIGLAIIMLIYETLGGFRAVAWTDVIQGFILMLGFVIVLVVVFVKFGGPGDAVQKLMADDEARFKVLPPEALVCRQWFSYVVIVGLGGALYPQAVQRIYAANSATTLRRSFAVMAFLPLTTTLIAVIVGVIGAAHMPGLEGTDADRILTIILREVQQESMLGYCLVVVMFAAILGALMSTADSAVLSISSMLTKDIYLPFVKPGAEQSHLTKLGKIISWGTIALLTAIAIILNQSEGKPTLVQLLDMKFDMLVQLAPAFMLGIHWKGMRGGPTFAGMAAGLVLALGLFPVKTISSLGIHAGLFGLLLNVTIAVVGSWWLNTKAAAAKMVKA